MPSNPWSNRLLTLFIGQFRTRSAHAIGVSRLNLMQHQRDHAVSLVCDWDPHFEALRNTLHQRLITLTMSDRDPILPSASSNPPSSPTKRRSVVSCLVVALLIAACIVIGIKGENGLVPKGAAKKAEYYLSRSPVIDGHIDLPELARVMYGNDITKFDLNKPTVSAGPRIIENNMNWY